jgi:N-acetyl-gamma-glutamyl-phosphate reductase
MTLSDLACAVSGAGQSLKENLLHAELSQGAHAYARLAERTVIRELDQEFSAIAGRPVEVHHCILSRRTAGFWRLFT